MKKKIVLAVVAVVALGLIATGLYWSKSSPSYPPDVPFSPEEIEEQEFKSVTLSPKEEALTEILALDMIWMEQYRIENTTKEDMDIYNEKVNAFPSTHGYSLDDAESYFSDLCREDLDQCQAFGKRIEEKYRELKDKS